jgi:hypothetical protein
MSVRSLVVLVFVTTHKQYMKYQSADAVQPTKDGQAEGMLGRVLLKRVT